MRLIVVGAMLAVGCSTDTFVGPDGGPTGGDGSSGDAIVADVSIDVASCAPTWCTTSPPTTDALCTDFDESSSIPSGWTSELASGSVSLSASPAEQCQSLHAHLDQVTGTSGTGRITHASAVNTTTGVQATLDLDVMLPTTDPGGQVLYFAIRANTVSIGLVRRADGTWWLQSSAVQTTPIASPLATEGPVRGAFTHMTLVVAYSPNDVNAELSYFRAGNNFAKVSGNATFVLPASVSYLVGMEATTATKVEQDAYYDDVVTSLQ